MERNEGINKLSKRYTISRLFRGKEIIMVMEQLKEGVSILLSGGDLSHIGAVYIRDNENNIIKHSFKSHKDYVLAEEWMNRLADVCNVPIVVTVGIHYDDISLEEITKIQNISADMLNEACLQIKSRLEQ